MERLGERIRSVVRRRVAISVGNRSDERDVLSDIAHDALLTAAERFADFRGSTDAELIAWVSAIAENKVCDHRRAARRQKRDVRKTQALAGLESAVSLAALRPDEAVMLAEERHRVREHVDRLPWRYRTAIRLRYFEEQPVAVVAAALRCSETAAQGVLKRALVWLRRVAGEGGDDASREISSRQLQRPR